MVAGGGRRGWRGERRGTRDAGAGREAVKENNRTREEIDCRFLFTSFCLFLFVYLAV